MNNAAFVLTNLLLASSANAIGAAAFSPASLFAASEPGGWYDPSDLTTLYQDAAGTTPVTAVEQPVGLVLDKSRGLAYGSELISNGSFANGTTGWTAINSATIAASGGELTVTAGSGTGNTFGGAAQTITTVIGQRYFIVASMKTASKRTATALSGASGYPTTTSTSYVTLQFSFVASSTSSQIGVFFDNTAVNGDTFTVRSVSVRELPGNHLSQSTAAARPVLSARVNLLTYTEQFDNAAWSKGNTSVTANATTDPLSGSTADAVFENALNAAHTVWLSVPTANSTSYTTSVYVKGIGRQYFRIRLGDGTTEFATVIDSVVFNLSGLGSISSAPSSGTASIEALANSWYRVSFTRASGTGGNTAVTFQFFQDASTGSYVGDITKGFYIWGADLRPANAGVGLPAYQRVGAAVSATTNPAVTGVPDYDTTGFPLYLKFDGTDDFLVSGTINPGSVNKAQVFAGVRKLSDAANGVVISGYNGATPNNRILSLWAPNGATLNNYGAALARSDPDYAVGRATTFTAPIANVVASFFDWAGAANADRIKVQINGAASTLNFTNSAGTLTTGNFSSTPYSVGRQDTGGYLNGHLYSLILRFSAANLDAATITATETWVNGKTKAF